MEKQKIKVLVIGDFDYCEDLFSIDLLDFEKTQLFNALELEEATKIIFDNVDMDIIIILESAFEYFDAPEDIENYGHKDLEDEVDSEDISEENAKLIQDVLEIYIESNPGAFMLGDPVFNEQEVKHILPRFINLIRSIGFSGLILASTKSSEIAGKFIKAGCSHYVTSIYGAHNLIDKAYSQKNKTLIV